MKSKVMFSSFFKTEKYVFCIYNIILAITSFYKESYQSIIGMERYNRRSYLLSELSEGVNYGGAGEVASQAAERAQVGSVSLEGQSGGGEIFQRENISGGRAGTAWGSSPGCFDGGKIVT